MSARNYPALRQADRGSVTRDRMREILEKNSNGQATLPPEPNLQWQEPVWTNTAKTHGYIISACERFMIDRADKTYNAYKRGTRVQKGEYLGFTSTVDGAKQLCEVASR